MTVCYPLTVQLDYTELRYSLRSIEKYLPSGFDVVIVGDHMPEWINNVTQLGVSDIKRQPNLSVRRKVVAALERYSEFLFFNDDIFLLQETGFHFPYYSSGTLKNKGGESGSRPLMLQLESLGKDIKYFGHYPAFYKKDFTGILENFPAECLTKSAYCNYKEVMSIEATDCKIITPKKPDQVREFIKDRPCFSTGVHSLELAVPVLEELFPYPSKFEI